MLMYVKLKKLGPVFVNSYSDLISLFCFVASQNPSLIYVIVMTCRTQTH